MFVVIAFFQTIIITIYKPLGQSLSKVALTEYFLIPALPFPPSQVHSGGCDEVEEV